MPKPGRHSDVGSSKRFTGGRQRFLYLNEQELAALITAFDRLTKEVTSKVSKRRIGAAGAEPIQRAARENSPVFKGLTRDPRYGLKTDEHYRYEYKGKGARRDAKGEGRIVGIYKAGHLGKSIQLLTGRKLKKAVNAVVGPVIGSVGGGKQKQRYGFSSSSNPRQVDAYYAQMIYGSAKEFGNRVMQVALRVAGQAALSAMTKETLRILVDAARKNRLA